MSAISASTVIGDALVRMLDFLGHEVIRENHIGDWGRPFGMLIEHLLDLGEDVAADGLSQGDLDGFYKQANAKFDERRRVPGPGPRARRAAAERRRGDARAVAAPRRRCRPTTSTTVYGKLGVLLTDDDLAGESMYQPLMPAGRRAARRGRSARGQRRCARRVPTRVHQSRGRPPAVDRARPSGRVQRTPRAISPACSTASSGSAPT